MMVCLVSMPGCACILSFHHAYCRLSVVPTSEFNVYFVLYFHMWNIHRNQSPFGRTIHVGFLYSNPIGLHFVKQNQEFDLSRLNFSEVPKVILSCVLYESSVCVLFCPRHLCNSCWCALDYWICLFTCVQDLFM
jgi:hypothetical protein